MEFVLWARQRNRLAFLVLVPLMAGPFLASAQDVLTAQQWREDLRYLADQISKTHPGAFHQIPQQQFETAVAKLDARIPALSDQEIEVEFARLVALLGEGHSRLSLPGLPDPMSDVPDITPFKDARLAFRRVPVKLYLFSDGLFVTAATPEFLVGARVLRIGGRPAEEALNAVRPIVSHDNDMGLRLISPELVVIPDLLYALHIIADPSRADFTFHTNDGKGRGRRASASPCRRTTDLEGELPELPSSASLLSRALGQESLGRILGRRKNRMGSD